jgi:hypothetical protein
VGIGKLQIKRLCFNIIFGIFSIFVCTENIIKFRPTSRLPNLPSHSAPPCM